MPLTISNTTGDGVHETQIQCNIERADTPGGTLAISGTVLIPGDEPQSINITPNSLTEPSPSTTPVYFIIQVDPFTGTASVKQSASAMPTPDLASQQGQSQTVLYSVIIPANETDPAIQDAVTTPDTI